MEMQDLLNMINAYDAGQEIPDATPAPEPDAQPDVDAQQPDTPAAEPTPVTPDVSTQGDKDANAFAEMRVQNKLFADTLKKIADATGIEYTNQDEMIAALNGDALTKLAAKQGVPVELLQRMEMLEKNSRLWEEQQLQQRLTSGFGALQQKYGLDQQAMMSFAQQLDAERVDLRNVDIEKEYVARNLDAIVAARVQAAVQAALSKDASIDAHSTAPTQQGVGVGGGGGAETQIKSAADLVSFLAANAPGGYK